MNPFVLNGVVPEKYFCDRKKETDKIVRALLDHANILLTSSRRMGKTQLIRHIYSQPHIKDSAYTFYTDIYATTGVQELAMYLSKEIYSQLVPRGKQALDRFLSVAKSISAGFTYSPLEAAPFFALKLGDIKDPELTLSEIFEYLEHADKPCIMAIDEFQKIGEYPQKNVEALLRTFVQRMTNCTFIFAGSNRHILENMFNSSAKPFYNSASQCHLDRIDRGVYIEFALWAFKENGRCIEPGAAALAYDLFDGHTYYVHCLLHDAFTYTDEARSVNEDDIRKTLDDIVEDRSHSFADQMSMLNYQQKEVIVAIAKEGKASGVTSVQFVRDHALKSPSSVQNALRTLLDRDLITFEGSGKSRTYSLSNRFLECWLKKTY